MTDAMPPDDLGELPAELLDEAYSMDAAITEERSPEAQEARVEAAAAAVEAENAAAPSEAEVAELYMAPPVEVEPEPEDEPSAAVGDERPGDDPASVEA